MIDLTAIPLDQAEPEVQDFGGQLTPALGGAVQTIDRVGTRWSFTFQTPDLPVEPDVRRWAARLARAKRQGALVWIPEPDLPAQDYGAPVVAAAVPAGTVVPLSGLKPGVTIVEGKWLSFIHDGRRYAYQVEADAVVAANGTVTIRVNPMLRTSLLPGDVAELAAPKVQGTIPGRYSWPIPVTRFASLVFVVAEDE